MRLSWWRTSAVALVAAFALLAAGCTSPVGGGGSASPSGTPVPRPTLDASFVARIDGSTATIPMMTAALRLLRDIERDWTTNLAGVDTFGHESAVFRLSDGHRMALSDFFYDGVNYIDFINRNLLDDGPDQALSTPDEDGLLGEQVAPFTGLPADTTDFGFANGQLVFWFAPGNPFLTNVWDDGVGPSRVPINLPTNLSPYGQVWGAQWVKVGSQTIEHVVSAYGETDPHDGPLNAAIDAWAAKQKSADFVWFGTGLRASGTVIYVTASQRSQDGEFYQLADATFDWATAKKVA